MRLRAGDPTRINSFPEDTMRLKKRMTTLIDHISKNPLKLAEADQAIVAATAGLIEN